MPLFLILTLFHCVNFVNSATCAECFCTQDSVFCNGLHLENMNGLDEQSQMQGKTYINLMNNNIQEVDMQDMDQFKSDVIIDLRDQTDFSCVIIPKDLPANIQVCNHEIMHYADLKKKNKKYLKTKWQ